MFQLLLKMLTLPSGLSIGRLIFLICLIPHLLHNALCQKNEKSKKGKQPNILFIMGDDMGWNDVDWHDPEMATPNLNKLNFDRHTIRLNHAYVNQLCSPTRSAFMTGYYPYHLGTQSGVFWVMEPSGVPLKFPFVAEKLLSLGYSTYLVGKWHLGYCKKEYLPSSRGFEKFHGFYGSKEGYYNHSRDLWDIKRDAKGLDFNYEERNGKIRPDWSNDGKYSPDNGIPRDCMHLISSIMVPNKNEQIVMLLEVFADDTIGHLKTHDRSKPFFINLMFQSVHAPVQVPDVYVEACSKKMHRKRRLYCGMVNALDYAIGRIVAALIAFGYYDNTIIVFSSDNGGENRFGGNNYPFRGNKYKESGCNFQNTLWEGGTRTNCFIHAPKFIQKNEERNALFHVVDWFATLSAAAGDDDMVTYGDGVNQWPMILGDKNAKLRNNIVYNIDKKGSAIRYGRYKLIAGKPGEPSGWIAPWEQNKRFRRERRHNRRRPRARGARNNKKEKWIWLFDLNDDPLEKKDLSDTHPELVTALLDKLEELEKSEVRSVHRALTDKGNPKHFNGTFSTGFC